MKIMARPERFELPTPRFVVWCSIQLSYGRVMSKDVVGAIGPIWKISSEGKEIGVGLQARGGRHSAPGPPVRLRRIRLRPTQTGKRFC